MLPVSNFDTNDFHCDRFSNLAGKKRTVRTSPDERVFKRTSTLYATWDMDNCSKIEMAQRAALKNSCIRFSVSTNTEGTPGSR
jgi:hypothetical protein